MNNQASIQSSLCLCTCACRVHEGDDGRLDKHHPHTRFQRLGTCSTAAERQAHLTGSRSGLLEQPGSSTGASGSLSAHSLHQRSLGLLLRTPTSLTSSLSNLHWRTDFKASWHTMYMCYIAMMFDCASLSVRKIGRECSHQSWSCITF